MLNAPRTIEGAGVWALVTRLQGQLRLAVGLSGGGYLGWDMGSALALGRAMGLAPWLLAEFLPGLEAVVMKQLNDGGEGSDG